MRVAFSSKPSSRRKVMTRGQYDATLATGYAAAKESMSPLQELSYGAFLRAILQAVGSIDSLRVGDFGCGTGDSTRKIAGLGKPRLLMGFDCSKDMLVRAQQSEGQRPLGILYEQTDCAMDLPGLTKRNFHLVTAMWLLHYAESIEMLAGFAKTAFDALSPNGRLVAVVQDKFEQKPLSAKYGERREWEGNDPPFVEGSRQRIYLLDTKGDSFYDLLVHYWERETYTRALQAAGFIDIKWADLRFDDSVPTIHNRAEVESSASCSLLTARRP